MTSENFNYRIVNVLRFWIKEDEINRKKMSDVIRNTTEWSEIQIKQRAIDYNLWDAKILISFINLA